MQLRVLSLLFGCAVGACALTAAHSQTILPVPADTDRAFAAKLAALSLEQAKAAISAAPAAQRTGGAAEALRQLGNQAIDTRPDDALPLYLEARQIARTLDQPALLCMADFGVGTASRLTGDTDAALEAFNEAVALAAKTTLAHTDRAKVYGGRAVARMYMGDPAGSIEDGQIALEEYKAGGDEVGVARTYNGLGNSQNMLGRFAEARASFEQGLALARKHNQRQGEGFLLNNIANTYLEENNPELAIPYCLDAIRIKEQIGNKEDLVTSLVNLARVYQGTSRDSEAVAAIERAYSLAQETKRTELEALTLAEWGAIDVTAHRPQLALEHLQRAMALSNGRGDLVREHQTQVQMAEAECDLGRYPDALAHAAQALDFADHAGMLSLVGSANRVIGKVHQKTGDLDKARSAFEQAVDAAEQMRDEAAGGAEAGSKLFAEYAEDLQDLAAVNAAQGNWQAAFAASEREKGRTLLDLLTGGRASLDAVLTPAERDEEHTLRAKLSSLERQSLQAATARNMDSAALASLAASRRAAYTSLAVFRGRIYAEHPDLQRRHARADLIALAQTSSLLPSPGTAIVEFEVTGSAILTFVITRGSDGPHLTGYTVPITRAALRNRIAQFMHALESRDPGFAAQSAALYRLLLAPAAKQLAGRSRLIVVPSAELWRVPLQALEDSRGRFLVERFAISYAPSLSVLRAYESHSAAPASLVAFGDPANDLPEAADEVRAAGRLYGPDRTTAFLHNAATIENFRASTATAHAHELLLATHGVYDDRNPMGSFLVLASGTPATAKTATLDAAQVADMKLSSALVVLSACETARGEYRAGEGMLGMSWSFLAAGSQAAVASQWRVDSTSTARLMTEFHRALRRGDSNAVALRQAELALMRDPQFHHPFYWAGFVVLGRP